MKRKLYNYFMKCMQKKWRLMTTHTHLCWILLRRWRIYKAQSLSIVWSSKLGLGHISLYEDAIKLFCEMRIVGLCPDQITIASALSACAELTVMEFCWSWFKITCVWFIEVYVSIDLYLLIFFQLVIVSGIKICLFVESLKRERCCIFYFLFFCNS